MISRPKRPPFNQTEIMVKNEQGDLITRKIKHINLVLQDRWELVQKKDLKKKEGLRLVEAAKKKIKKIKREKASAGKRDFSLQNEICQQDSIQEQTRESIEELRDLKNEYKHENILLMRTLEDIKTTIESKTARMKSYQSYLMTHLYDTDLFYVREDLKKLEEQYNSMEIQFNHGGKNRADLENQIALVKDELERASEAFQSLDKKSIILKNELSLSEHQKKEAEENLRHLEANTKSNESERENYLMKISALEEKNNMLESEIKILQD